MFSNSVGLIAAADALDVRSMLMKTDVPLTAYSHPIKTQHFMQEGSLKVTDLNGSMSPDPNVQEELPRKTSVDTVYKTWNGLVGATIIDQPILNVPPPTRTVTPMLSLYATVKISNIRMILAKL